MATRRRLQKNHHVAVSHHIYLSCSFSFSSACEKAMCELVSWFSFRLDVRWSTWLPWQQSCLPSYSYTVKTSPQRLSNARLFCWSWLESFPVLRRSMLVNRPSKPIRAGRMASSSSLSLPGTICTPATPAPVAGWVVG